MWNSVRNNSRCTHALKVIWLIFFLHLYLSGCFFFLFGFLCSSFSRGFVFTSLRSFSPWTDSYKRMVIIVVGLSIVSLVCFTPFLHPWKICVWNESLYADLYSCQFSVFFSASFFASPSPSYIPSSNKRNCFFFLLHLFWFFSLILFLLLHIQQRSQERFLFFCPLCSPFSVLWLLLWVNDHLNASRHQPKMIFV